MAEAPVLTMPEAEAALLRETYAGAGVILEYGAGGSTLVAATSAAKAVITVESDRQWLAKVASWFTVNPAAVPVTLHHGNIGPTRKWGFPAGIAKSERWPGYALSVWDRADFQHPDVVLVDGRFRLACMLATLFHITRPVRRLCRARQLPPDRGPDRPPRNNRPDGCVYRHPAKLSDGRYGLDHGRLREPSLRVQGH